MCEKMNQGPIISFFQETLTWKGYDHMTVSAKFPLSETNFWSIFRKDFGGIKERKQKGVNWYIFHIFRYFFRCWQYFWGIKHLHCHFWKFCSLELIKEINRNSFMPLSTNSDAFQSPKKLVSKLLVEVSNCSRMWAVRLQRRMMISSPSLLMAIQEPVKRNLWQLYTQNSRKLNHSPRPLFHSPWLLFHCFPLDFQNVLKPPATVNYKSSRPFII